LPVDPRDNNANPRFEGAMPLVLTRLFLQHRFDPAVIIDFQYSAAEVAGERAIL
jgi:hypothetical protein